MGNQACCDVRNTEYKEKYPQQVGNSQIKQVQLGEGKKLENQNEPQLTPQVRERLQYYKNEEQQKMPADASRRVFRNELYIGQLDEEKRPSGYGKIYKSDGSVYLGQWVEGKAQGHGVYIAKDGAYYQGNFKQNRAEGQGHFFSGAYNYQGYFENNKYHGIGTQRNNLFNYHGSFSKGQKVKGTLSWKDQQGEPYEYYGEFNEKGEFEGRGKLNEPNGSYQGEFRGGEKHGDGVYKFSNGLKYEGQYQNGKKQGKGSIINCNDSVAYEGDFADDLPHGQGFVYDRNGNKQRRRWINGIDAQGVQQ